jgi:GNAT superfamily N-acetyltransferase
MPRLEIRAFTDDFVPAAGELLAARHRAHRAAEPLLSARYEDPAAAAGEVEALSASESASGAVALRDGRVVGFLLGTRKSDDTWGANVWVDPAGHAVEEAEDLRDLYAAAAAVWVDAGRTRHYALVPASDRALVDAWFRLSFGCQHAHGVQEVPAVEWPPVVRRAEPRDVDYLIELSPVIRDHQDESPVFGRGVNRVHEDDAELRAMLLEDMADDELGELVCERDGQVIAAFEVVPAEKSSVHASLARPDGAALLGWAASLPQVRGTGAGVALTQATFAWAHERGFGTMVTDWRETNLLSSRFWPARGFRRTFLRLYRSIP